MLRKVYETYADEKRDQRVGFVAFPLVSIVVAIVVSLLNQQIAQTNDVARVASLRSTAALLPWAVNGAIILGAFIFRSQLAVGYLVGLAGWTVVGVALGLIAVVAYFLSAPLIGLAGLIGALIFLLLIAGVSIWFLIKMFGLLRRWWAI